MGGRSEEKLTGRNSQLGILGNLSGDVTCSAERCMRNENASLMMIAWSRADRGADDHAVCGYEVVPWVNLLPLSGTNSTPIVMKTPLLHHATGRRLLLDSAAADRAHRYFLEDGETYCCARIAARITRTN